MDRDRDRGPKHWLQTLPGILTAVTALIGAIATLIGVLRPWSPDSKVHADASSQAYVSSSSTPPDGCMPPYVWRLAVPSDHVCVTVDSRNRVEAENQRAAERREASGSGVYGADTCLVGYVWRGAFEGDTVCVLPARRDEVAEENAMAAKLSRP